MSIVWYDKEEAIRYIHISSNRKEKTHTDSSKLDMDYQPKFNKGYSIGDAAVYSKNSQVKPSDLAALQCPLCELVLRDPVQVINCGHRFCKGCLEVVTSARFDSHKFANELIRELYMEMLDFCFLRSDCECNEMFCQITSQSNTIPLEVTAYLHVAQ